MVAPMLPSFATSQPFVSHVPCATSAGHRLRRERLSAIYCLPVRHTFHASAVPGSPPPSPSYQPSTERNLSAKIAGTPCFTPRIMASPMAQNHRDVYLEAAAKATAAYLSTFEADANNYGVAKITLNVPQLNPEFDIYDRRFLLQLAWAVVDVTAASCKLRTRVLIQGTGAFGAIPLSVAGLRRNFDADVKLSGDAWPEDIIRTGSLDNEDDLADDDQIIVVISPTNAVSIPVIGSLIDMVRRAKGRPVILLNPRLDDVPSHSGVMQVSGRANRIRFLEAVTDIYYLRLLFNSGTVRFKTQCPATALCPLHLRAWHTQKNYPLRGILHRAYPGPWQLWRPEEGDTKYNLISTSDHRPSPSEITDAFAVDRYARQKKLLKEAADSGSITTIESLFGAVVNRFWPR